MPAKRFVNISQFNSDWVKFNGRSAAGDVVVVDQEIVADIDLTLLHDSCLTGAMFIVKGGKIGDKVSLQVVGGSTVLDEFITDWYIVEDSDKQFMLDLTYPANLPSGLKIRAVYVSSATAGVRNVRINYFLHKVMVSE